MKRCCFSPEPRATVCVRESVCSSGPPGRHVHGLGTGWVTLSCGFARCLFIALLAFPRCGEDVQAKIPDPPPPTSHPEEVSRRAPSRLCLPLRSFFTRAQCWVSWSCCPLFRVPTLRVVLSLQLPGRMNPGHSQEVWVWRSVPPVPRAALPACGKLSGSWHIAHASTHGSV